jgi:CBS domain-containing protein
MIEQSVGDVMTHSVRTVSVAETGSAVARLFAADRIGSAVVVDDEGDVLGIVTESDLMRQIASDADVTAVQVGSFMSAPVVTTTSTAPIDAAAELMRDYSVRRLPVVDDGRLVGMLTTTNLAHYIPRLRDAIRRARTGSKRSKRSKQS